MLKIIYYIYMKKCLRCNSSLKVSPHNKMTGYESYRCTNSNCKALFDVSDLNYNNNLTKEGLIKPQNLKFNQGDYFVQVVKDNFVEVPIGMGKSHIVMRILEENNNAFGVFNNTSIVKAVVIGSSSPEKIKPNIYIACSRFLDMINNYDDFVKNYKYCILDDLDSNFVKSIVKTLGYKGFDTRNIFIFKSKP